MYVSKTHIKFNNKNFTSLTCVRRNATVACDSRVSYIDRKYRNTDEHSCDQSSDIDDVLSKFRDERSKNSPICRTDSRRPDVHTKQELRVVSMFVSTREPAGSHRLLLLFTFFRPAVIKFRSVESKQFDDSLRRTVNGNKFTTVFS